MGKLRHRGAVTCSRLRSLADVIVESRSRLALRAWSEIGPSPLCPLPSQLVPWLESYLDFLGDSEDSSPESQVPLPGVESGLEGRGQRGERDQGGVLWGPMVFYRPWRKKEEPTESANWTWTREMQPALGDTQGGRGRTGALWEESQHS